MGAHGREGGRGQSRDQSAWSTGLGPPLQEREKQQQICPQIPQEELALRHPGLRFLASRTERTNSCGFQHSGNS